MQSKIHPRLKIKLLWNAPESIFDIFPHNFKTTEKQTTNSKYINTQQKQQQQQQPQK